MKQFALYQDRCAMKVTSDGVLFGAWVQTQGPQRILDIGTGTGLLACMLAQRNPEASIDAIEIDPEAAAQASENIAASPWFGRIRVWPLALQDYLATNPGQYDLLISNPPFFSRSSKPADAARCLARHDDTLPPRALLDAAESLLSPQGRMAVIYPPPEAEGFFADARHRGFSCDRRLHLFSTAAKPLHRVGLEIQRPSAASAEPFGLAKPSAVGRDADPPATGRDEVVAIHPPGGVGYTEEYKRLLQAFVLHV